MDCKYLFTPHEAIVLGSDDCLVIQYAVGDIFGIVVGGAVYTILSKIFPDHTSMIAKSVYAQEALEARWAATSSESDEYEKKDDDAVATHVMV